MIDVCLQHELSAESRHESSQWKARSNGKKLIKRIDENATQSYTSDVDFLLFASPLRAFSLPFLVDGMRSEFETNQLFMDKHIAD